MIEPLRQFFFGPKRASRRHSVPAGTRYYVVGDVHGRLDLFEALRDGIETDDAQAGEADSTIVLLGDLVDRGPDSAGVIEAARQWQQERKVRILAGNHEEMFLDAFEDVEVLRHFLKFGGRETVLSYDISREEYNGAEVEEVQALMHRSIPAEHREFIAGFEECVQAGDYLFVHAGIDPLRPLEEQRRHDMLWIRDRFLRHTEPHPHMVVHGHTIAEKIDERSNRIGIDTGAYKSGRLTALVLEGEERRYIQAVEADGKIEIEHRSSRA